MNLSLIGIFLEGLLSFLSPCVLPLLPLYMSYLAGEDNEIDGDGNVKYKTSRVFISTLFFVLGICLTLALFAISVNVVKQFLDKYTNVISIVFGTILIIFGLHECGLIHIDVLDFDSRYKLNIKSKKMNIFKAFLLGFFFSLGWSPCIGPMLANALMLATTEVSGYLYIVFYGLGLTMPFLITGLLTSTVLNFINSKKNIMKWVLKVAGIIMICFGIYMICSSARKINYTSNNTINNTSESFYLDYEFSNQKGKKIKLSDYKGKYVFLNFTTTWCTYCNSEIPEYLEFSKSEKDVVCLYVMSPSSSGVNKDELIKYIDKNIELQVIVDEDDVLMNYFGIQSFPTKIFISKQGEIMWYYPGALTKDGFVEILKSAKESN